MSVSVIVTSYNDGAWLEDCLASVVTQEMPASEIILVDDGTTDPASLEGQDRALRRFPQTRLIKQENQGPSAARNRGLAEAMGEWIAFVDADDRLRPDNLSFKLALSQGRTDVVASYGGYVTSGSGSPPRLSRFRPYLGSLDPSLVGKSNGVPGGLPLYLFRTKALREVGGLDPSLRIMEDFDMILRIGRAGGLFVGCNEPIYLRNLRPGSLSRSAAGVRYRKTLRFLNKALKQRYFPPQELGKRHLLALGEFAISSIRQRTPDESAAN